MGSGCTKSGPESVPRELAAGEAADEATEETTAGQVVEGKKAECMSIKSTSTSSSRPPTPFARPITAPVIARPKTTTISERAEYNITEEGEDGEELLDENLESLHPPKMKRTHSRNGDLLGGEQVGHRKLSRHIHEDDEDIMKMKEYMEQKGL